MADGTLCEMKIDRAGLLQRTNVLLARERNLYPAMVDGLFSTGKGEIEHPPLTAEVLEEALTSPEPGRAYSAAFVIGRCRAGDAAIDGALTRRLEEILDKAGESDTTIEAAMSLALRGKLERARQSLQRLLNSPHPLGDQYKAAFYLAQMGDPSGYGALVRTLHSEIPHYRLMALRHVIAFLPYDGQRVGELVVDVHGLVLAGFVDPDEFVRSEVPFYLAELHPSDLIALLEPVELHDPSPTVRMAAQIVLRGTGRE